MRATVRLAARNNGTTQRPAMMQIVPGQNERQLVAAVVEALGLPLGALGEVTVDGFSIRNSDALMNADDIVFEPTEIPAGTLAPSHSEDTLSFPPEGAPAMNKAAPHTAAAAAPAAATAAVPEHPSQRFGSSAFHKEFDLRSERGKSLTPQLK